MEPVPPGASSTTEPVLLSLALATQREGVYLHLRTCASSLPKMGVFSMIEQIIMKDVYLSISIEQYSNIFNRPEHNLLAMFNMVEYNGDIPKICLSPAL